MLVKTLAHEMGHSLGMNGHTEDTNCHSGQYLMSANITNRSHPVTTLSQCTKKIINEFLNKKIAQSFVTEWTMERMTQEDVDKVNSSRLAYCWYRSSKFGIKILSREPSNERLVVSNQLQGKETIWIVIGCTSALLILVAIGIGLIYQWKAKKRCLPCFKKRSTIV